MAHILIVEDNLELAGNMKAFLEQSGYETACVRDGKETLKYLEEREVDLILLDMVLPDITGAELCVEIRKMSDCPVIYVSCVSDTETIVKALENGGDDYLVKPFAFEELLARIRAMLRREGGRPDNCYRIADLVVDCDARTAARGNVQITLSSKEFSILEYLICNQGIVLTREKIEQHIWNYDYEGGSNVVDVYIRYLRKKIDDGFSPKLIHTVRGVGYVLKEA